MRTTETYRGYRFDWIQHPSGSTVTRLCLDEDTIFTVEANPASTAIAKMLAYIDQVIDQKKQPPTEKVELNNKFVFGAYQCVYKQQPDGSWTGTLMSAHERAYKQQSDGSWTGTLSSELSSYENFFIAPDVDKLFTMFNTWVHARLNGH